MTFEFILTGPVMRDSAMSDGYGDVGTMSGNWAIDFGFTLHGQLGDWTPENRMSRKQAAELFLKQMPDLVEQMKTAMEACR